MSITNISVAKHYLNIILDDGDEQLQLLLDAAEDEALQFLDIGDDLSVLAEDDRLPASVTLGILILLQASYQASPDEAKQLREIAETKLFPYRKGLGV